MDIIGVAYFQFICISYLSYNNKLSIFLVYFESLFNKLTIFFNILIVIKYSNLSYLLILYKDQILTDRIHYDPISYSICDLQTITRNCFEHRQSFRMVILKRVSDDRLSGSCTGVEKMDLKMKRAKERMCRNVES